MLLILGMFLLFFGIPLLIYFLFYQSKGILRIRYLLDKKNRYATIDNSNKLFVVGGSDVLYSFNTETIQEHTQIISVNYGTNVGLGLGFILDEIEKNIKEGDSVVLCLAYSLYYNPPYHIFAYEYYRMFDKKKLVYFSFFQQFVYLVGNAKLNFSYKQKKFNLSETGCYLNVSGANLHDKKNKPLQFPEYFKKNESIKKLEEFSVFCKKNNINVSVTYPNTLEFPEYKKTKYLNELVSYLEENYDVIGKPEDYMVPKEHIFDSVYHVNELGQTLRTQKFIEEFY